MVKVRLENIKARIQKSMGYKICCEKYPKVQCTKKQNWACMLSFAADMHTKTTHKRNKPFSNLGRAKLLYAKHIS